jgi:hypothetical protein
VAGQSAVCPNCHNNQRFRRALSVTQLRGENIAHFPAGPASVDEPSDLRLVRRHLADKRQVAGTIVLKTEDAVARGLPLDAEADDRRQNKGKRFFLCQNQPKIVRCTVGCIVPRGPSVLLTGTHDPRVSGLQDGDKEMQTNPFARDRGLTPPPLQFYSIELTALEGGNIAVGIGATFCETSDDKQFNNSNSSTWT